MARQETDFLEAGVSSNLAGLKVCCFRQTDRGIIGSNSRLLALGSTFSEADDLIKVARQHLSQTGEPEITIFNNGQGAEIITNTINVRTIVQRMSAMGYVSDEEYKRMSNELGEGENIPVQVLSTVHDLVKRKTRKIANKEIDKRMKGKKSIMDWILGR